MRAPTVLLLLGFVSLSACKRGHGPKEGRGKDAAPEPPATGTAPAPQKGKLTPANGGATVYDAERNVTWLAEFNLPATKPLGVDGIHANGAMSYKSALQWVEALNKSAHLGHTDWELPKTPPVDATCDRKNRYNFGYGCQNSAFGGLYQALGFRFPQTTVPMPKGGTVKGFVNLQPYLYWSESSNANHPENENGYTTLSFANGFQGSNVARNYIYALPLVEGRFVPKSPADEARVVHDGDVTWLADGNLAATQTFGVAGIAPTGAMPHDVALKWVAAMNAHDGGKGWLGTNRWKLPATAKSDPSCTNKDTFGFDCTGSPLGRLYYRTLGMKRGEPAVKAPDTNVGPFHGIEPYLYWACQAADDGKGCSQRKDDPVAGFGWSFSFGNGFQGTTTRENLLYVTAYYPGPPR